MSKPLPDVHEQEFSGRSLQKVGVRELRLPIAVEIDHETLQDTIGDFSCYVNLTEAVRGANMSFFAILLYEHLRESPLTVGSLCSILRGLREKLSTKTFTPEWAYVKVRFPAYLPVKAPASRQAGYRWYNCILEGRAVAQKEESPRVFLTVEVQTIATCPCSKELAVHLEEEGNEGRSMPHQQRGTVSVTVEIDIFHPTLVEELVQWIERALVSVPYPIIKRTDEQRISKTAYDNAYFVEDAARLVGDILDRRLVKDWVVVVNHYESIHQHVAVGIAYKGIEGGLR